MFVHRERSAHGSAIERRINQELGVTLSTTDQTAELTTLHNDVDYAFMYDPTGLPTEVIEKMQWLVFMQNRPADMSQIEDIQSPYFVHAPEFRRIARSKKHTPSPIRTRGWTWACKCSLKWDGNQSARHLKP